jgi:hypothetical protein
MGLLKKDTEDRAASRPTLCGSWLQLVVLPAADQNELRPWSLG